MTRDGGGCRQQQSEGGNLRANRVVLAISPYVWSSVEYDTETVRDLKPQMGRNVECLISFTNEYWKNSKLSPNLASDLAVGLTWNRPKNKKDPAMC
jgi:hypothetical protein